MYRVAKKTTKKTQYKCLECPHIKPAIYKKEFWGCRVECNAPNKCLIAPFNAKDYYCVEVKSLNEMSKAEQEKFRDKVKQDYADKEYRKWAKKFHTPEEAKELIKKRKESRK